MEYLSPRIGKSGAWYPDHHLKTKGTLWKFSRPPKGTPTGNYIKNSFQFTTIFFLVLRKISGQFQILSNFVSFPADLLRLRIRTPIFLKVCLCHLDFLQ